MADRLQRPRRVETFGGDCYKVHETEAYMDQLETELENYRLTFRAIERQSKRVDALHREIIDQGRKVLNATSDIGMSHSEFIEWALERLEGKL